MNNDVKLFLILTGVLGALVGYSCLESKYQLLIAVHVAFFLMTIVAYHAMCLTLLCDAEDDSKSDPTL